MREVPDVIQVTSIHWIHRDKINTILEKIYAALLTVSNAPLEKLLSTVVGSIGNKTLLPPFMTLIENELRREPNQFGLVNEYQKIWRAIPEGQRDNELLYKLLYRCNSPLTEDEIIARNPEKELAYDLISDQRFQSFPGNRWGLPSWICLNEAVYEYLLRTKKHLHEIAVVGYVCNNIGYSGYSAFFFPDDDLRFVRDSLNRLFCRHELTTDELNRLLSALDYYGGIGRKLEQLFREVLHLSPDETNAYQILPPDSRFIHLDDLWYSHKEAYREVSIEDIEKIFSYLSLLPTDSPAISLKDIGLAAIQWDGRLTNAADLMAKDERFVEVHESFWILNTWLSPDYDRSSRGGVAVIGSTTVLESDTGITVALPETLTGREHPARTGSPQDIEQKSVYHTLSFLDILHGNIRISGLLKKWLPKTCETIHLFDNENNESIAYVDETHSILNIRDWIHKRELSYGDKIYFQPGSQSDNLYIRPYGERDQRVYQEALQHQDIEKLIDDARRVNMTYHDLMMEVMEAMSIPLHREDIFQLVDYRRTAARSTIFEILSLSECPYDELRYFVPKGRGYWYFDRQRKKVFDMKMNELLTENESLKNQVTLLANHIASEEDNAASTQLKQKIQSLKKSIEDLIAEKSSLSNKIQALEAEKSLREPEYQLLKEDLALTQQHFTELSETHANTLSELESLRLEQITLQEKETQLQIIQTELDGTRQQLVQLQSASSQQEATYNIQVADLNNELDALRNQLQQAKSVNKNTVDQIKDLISNSTRFQEEFKASKILAEEETSALKNQLAIFTHQVSELNNQLHTTSEEIASVQAEKEAVQVQLDQTQKQYQSSQELTAHELASLNTHIQKLNTDLEARSASIQVLEKQLITRDAEKTTIIDGFAAERTQLTQQISMLQSQLNILEPSHANQTQELAVMSARLKRIDRALATPLGRLFTRLQGLK